MKPRRSPRGPGPAEPKKGTEAIGTRLRSFPPAIRRTTRRSNDAPAPPAAKAAKASPERKAAPASKQKPGPDPVNSNNHLEETADLKQPATRKVKDDNNNNKAAAAASEAEPAETGNGKPKATTNNVVRQSSRRSSRRLTASTSDDKEEEAAATATAEEEPMPSMTRRSSRHSSGATTASADTNGSVKSGRGKNASKNKEEEEDGSLSEKSVAKAVKKASANGSEVKALPILGKRKASEDGTRDTKRAGRSQQAKTENVSVDSSDNIGKDNASDDEEDDEERKVKKDGVENGTARAGHSKGKGKKGSNENDTTLHDDSKKGENGKHQDEITEKPPPRRSRRSRDKTTASRKSPNELDESTLQAVQTYLSENIDGDELLDEVELVSFMLRMDRLSTEQTRYQQKLVGDSDEEDEELYNDILAEEEEHALGQSFFKSVLYKVKKQNDEISLDRGTLDWIRRAAGLQKNNLLVHSRQTATASREPGVTSTRMSAKRYTRGMARTSRTQKRKKDMRHLTDAVDELEKEFGPFERKRPAKRSREPLQSVSPQKVSDDVEPIIPIDPPLKRKKGKALVARMPILKSTKRGVIVKGHSSHDVRVSKVLVDGEHIGRGTDDWDVFKAELMKERAREYKEYQDRMEKGIAQKGEYPGGSYRRAAERTARRDVRRMNRRDARKDARNDARREARRDLSRRDTTRPPLHKPLVLRKPPAEAPLSLALRDWQRRDLISSIAKGVNVDILTETEYRNRLKKGLPTSYTEAGIVYRLPEWKAMNPASSGASYRTPFEPQRVRHSDEVYASNCQKLVTVLQGSARAWAVCEFFYNDLDKAWYNRSKFTEDVAKLGVPPGAMLTRREWTAIRRRIPNKPRRFTQRFIASQFNERNEYRNTVRMLQRNVGLASSLRFPYDVPAPIRVGNIVTAYNRKYRVIHRGVVLSYDERSARYLVQFERKEFGHDFCPDSEVASHGIPELLFRAPERTLAASVTGVAGDVNNVTDNLPCTSTYGSVPGFNAKPDAVVTDAQTKLFPFRPLAFHGARNNERRHTGNSRESNSLLEKVAEHEALLTLMSCVETASARKKMLLDAMEDFNAHMAQRLPFGDDASAKPAMPPQEQQHYTWLLANLEQTNRLLERALRSLRTMYGDAYLPSANEANEAKDPNIDRLEQMERTLGNVLAKREALPPMALPWIVELVVGAEDLGETIVASCLHPETRAEKEKQDNERTIFMKGRLASLGGLLLTASYGQGDTKGPSRANNTTIATALAIGSHKLVSTDLPPAPYHGEELYAEMMATRDMAVKDLQEAVDLLNAEHAAASVRQVLES